MASPSEEAEDRVSLEYVLQQLQQEYEEKERDERENNQVFLNVYDMLSLNSYISPLGLGAFHSGVEVYGREYAYGSHPYSYTGVYDMSPRQAEEITGQRVQFRESIPLGHTHLSKLEVRELMLSIEKEYSGCVYSVLHRNCNHFTADLCQRLCRATPPRWINRLAYIGSWMPFLLNCLPPQWLNPDDPNSLLSSQSRYQSLAPGQHGTRTQPASRS